MSTRLIQYSVVVVGQAHNPTILNPDFLASENIVSREWDWRVADTITTPALAFVRYQNGVSLTVEQNKLQVVDPNVQQGVDDSKAGQIAIAYVQTLRHVRYTATEKIFNTFLGTDLPGPGDANRDGRVSFADFLRLQQGFGKPGTWDDGDFNMDGLVTFADFLILQQYFGEVFLS